LARDWNTDFKIQNDSEEEGKMNLNDITKFPRPLKGVFFIKSGMINHSDLDCLRQFQKGGKVEVQVVGFSKIDGNRILLHFSPLGCPEVKKFALRDFLEVADLEKFLSL